jgi:hypothetical protein
MVAVPQALPGELDWRAGPRFWADPHQAWLTARWSPADSVSASVAAENSWGVGRQSAADKSPEPGLASHDFD